MKAKNIYLDLYISCNTYSSDFKYIKKSEPKFAKNRFNGIGNV